MNFAVVLLALFVLRPLRSWQMLTPEPQFAAVQRPT